MLNTEDYRLISLSWLEDVSETVDAQIRNTVFEGNPLHRKQRAYQLWKSVESTVHKIADNIKETGKKLILKTFLDMEINGAGCKQLWVSVLNM